MASSSKITQTVQYCDVDLIGSPIDGCFTLGIVSYQSIVQDNSAITATRCVTENYFRR